MQNPPRVLEEKLFILQSRAFKLKAEDEEGAALRQLLQEVEIGFNETEDVVRQQHPLAFFKPSYEQSLLLNAWIWGIDFPVCFAANRIGKTTVFIVNACLWIFPNNPDWEMFAANYLPNKGKRTDTKVPNPDVEDRFYWDEFDRPVQVLQRPTIESLDLIRQTLKLCPELIGDPALSHLEGNNVEKFTRLQELIPQAFRPAFPHPSITESGSIWVGAPDNLYHKTIIMPEWKKWLPKHSVVKWTESEFSFKLTSKESVNPIETMIDVICKSYDSEDTKWSGSAVLAIVLTEGIPPLIFNEIRQRIKEYGFGSWDYTPYEARNVGAKTSLAFKVFKGEEQLPLKSHIFTRFSARKAPPHILPTSKRDDLIRMWQGKAEGDARLDGVFYTNSPLVLSKLSRPFHCVPWTVEELFARYPTGQIYRGLDPGKDHPTACCWGLLTPGNIWYLYRFYSERQTTINQRCKDIVQLSGNQLKRKRYGPKRDDFNLVEVHLSPRSEPVVLTATDFHVFKQDEVTGQNYTNHYTKAGLVLTESTHMAPEDRAVAMDNKLDKNEYHVHPVTERSPGCKIFFLINGYGVDQALGKMESLFWDRLAGGPNKGEAKDTVPSHGDDELDAACYVVCGPYVWTTYQPKRINEWIDEEAEQLASL